MNPEIMQQPMIDVTLAPYGADPTGKEDATGAILRALNDVTALTLGAFGRTLNELSQLPFDTGRDPRGVENRKVNGKIIGIFASVIPYVPTLYFPEGTYTVSDTLCYQHPFLNNTGGSDLNTQIRIRGAGPEKTVIRLKDQAEGFQGEEPKSVVRFIKNGRTNVAMSNYIEDLCIDTGRGNPSAVGLDFYANNSGAARNLLIRSGDGAGFAGLMLGHSNYSGILIQHITVRGFDSGLHLDSESGTMFMAGEHIRLENQNLQAVYAGNPSISLSEVHATGAPCGVKIGGHSGLLVLVDSSLEGRGPHAVAYQTGVAYFSNVRTSGYERTLSQGGEISADIASAVLADGQGAEVDESDRLPRLPVEQPPSFPDRPDSRCQVDDFGALKDGMHDDAPAIQAALDSGAAEVHFGAGKYLLNQPVRIPGHVTRLSFHFCDLVTGPDLQKRGDAGVFVVEGENADPLLFEDLFGWEQFRGDCVTIDHASTRTLVISDVHTQTLSLYRNSVEGGKVFLENAACTTGVVPGDTHHSKVCLRFKGQRVWARQLNPERGHPMVINDGGSLWVLGFKTEDDATGFLTLNGGRTELLGGILNFGGDLHPAFEARDSGLRASATSNSWEGQIFQTVVRDQSAEALREIKGAELPRRNYTGPRGKLFSLPLYTSFKQDKS